MKESKTNALRMLDKLHIDYETREYEYIDNHEDKSHITNQSDLSTEEIYKTLVLSGTHGYLVCCIPVLEEIDLKKLARASNNKSVEMIAQKDLLNLTGYMRGGCSPIGMKKKFDTYFQEDIILQEKVAVSAGRRGLQVILKPDDLIKCVDARLVDVIRV